MRVLFCGSRYWEAEQPIAQVLNELNPETDLIIHGAAAGADTIAGRLARKLDFKVESYPANWNLHGKAAGPVRNKQMLATGIDKVYAFPLGESRGTRHMVRIAIEAGVEVEVYGEADDSW